MPMTLPQFAVFAERQIVLADLIVLDKIGVEVALAVELAEFRDFAPGQKSGAHGLENRFVVLNRQCSWISEADRAGQRVRLGSVAVFAGAEHFALRPDLDMDFNADDCFVFHILQICLRG